MPYYPQPTYDYPAPKLRGGGPDQLLDPSNAPGGDLQTKLSQLGVQAQQIAKPLLAPPSTGMTAPSQNAPGVTQGGLRQYDSTPDALAAINSAQTVATDPNAKFMGPPGYMRHVPNESYGPQAAPGVVDPSQPAPGGPAAPAVATQPPLGGGPSMGVIDSSDARQKFFDEANLRNAAAKGSWSPRKGYQSDEAAIAAASIPIQNRQKLAEMSLKNTSDQTIAAGRNAVEARGQDSLAGVANARNITEQRGQDITAATAKGAQDVTLKGYESTAKTAAAVARLDQMNKDRTFNLDSAKFGVDQAKTAFEQREAADKNFTGQLESRYRMKDADGKDVVDQAAVAAHKNAAQNLIAGKIDQLMKVPPNSPDYAQAQKLADDMRSKGISALGPNEKSQLESQLELKRRAEASAGPLPWQGKYVESNDPSAYNIVGTDKGLTQDQAVLANGTQVPMRQVTYQNGGNGVLPNSYGDATTTRFNNIKRLKDGSQ